MSADTPDNHVSATGSHPYGTPKSHAFETVPLRSLRLGVISSADWPSTCDPFSGRSLAGILG